MSVMPLLFHTIAVIESAAAIWVFHSYVHTKISKQFGGRWKFLTYINLWVQLAFFISCLIHDLFEMCGLRNLKKAIQKFKDVFFAGIALPSCLYVFLTFWGIYAIDRELVHPKKLDEFLPSWTNHMWHTCILITVLEIGVTSHQFPSKIAGLAITSFYSLGYLVWLEYVQYKAGIYIYPFIKAMTNFQFALFVLVSLATFGLIYLFGEFLNNLSGKTKRKKNE